MSIPKNVINHLKKLKVPYEAVTHRTVFTAYDLAQTLKIKLNDIAKTLLVKVDKEYKLVVLPAKQKLDMAKLKKLLKAKKVSIAREGEMKTKFNVKPGAITPFGTLHKVQVIIDRSLTKSAQALFGAGSFTESLRIKIKDYLKSEQPVIGSIGESSGLKLQARPAKKKVVKKRAKTKPRKSKPKKK
ncbi:YbaK/EbsC family protein [Patescibacteria group bacterium]